jgi:hypothetical protein
MTRQPPGHPEWVTVLNTMGRGTGSDDALVDLSEESLLAAAIEATGGLSDFGDDAWREPFRILLDDVVNVSRLTLLGRLQMRNELLRSLMGRLQIEETYKQHPEIDDEVIEAPVFIAGMARSGTTITFELMAEDTQFRSPLTWELQYPCPPPEAATRGTDPRRQKTGADMGLWGLIAPEFLTMHETSGTTPDECHIGMLMEFTSPIWGSTQNVPNHSTWIAMNDGAQGYRFHRRLLKLLQWKTPGRWLLKGPAHLSTLPALFAEYADARLIMTHRDLLKTIPSLASLLTTMRSMRSDDVDPEEIGGIAAMSPYLFDMVMEWRRNGAVPDDRIVDVQYGDMMRDPIVTLRGTYEELGIVLTPDAEARMRALLDARPKGRHGSHRYGLTDFGIDPVEMRKLTTSYMERYEVEVER